MIWGSGSYPALGLAEARRVALDARALLALGKDPLEERKQFVAAETVRAQAKTLYTFNEAALAVHKVDTQGFRNSKHAAQWLRSLELYVLPSFGNHAVAELTPAHFAGALREMWRGTSGLHISTGLALFDLHGCPIRRGPWRKMGGSRLRGSHVDCAKRAHESPRSAPVPLSRQALDILLQAKNLGSDSPFIFPSRKDSSLSDMALTKLLRDSPLQSGTVGRSPTAHGFRSSFRDLASENGKPRDIAEGVLTHTIANQVEAAYHRTDLLEARL